MGTIRRFEDIECWQAARVLVGLIYSLTRKDGFRHDFELASQIRRSAVSSMANIAEGFHRSSTRDFLKFLDYSRASIAETISHGYVAFDQGYITDQEMSDMKNQAELAWKKVNNFMTYLKSTNKQTSKPTNRLTNQPTNRLTNQPTNQQTNKPNK